MKEISIPATTRERVGRGSGRRTRAEWDIPAVIYGPEVDPIAIAVNERGLRAALKGIGMSSIINLDVNGKTTKTVIREVQRDPISSRAIHIDFHAISMTKPLHISVPIHFEGIPLGVKVDGGIMQVTMREMAVSCLPSDIPEQIEVNVEELSIGDSIHVKDLEVPNVKLLAEPQRTVVVISAPTIVKVDVVRSGKIRRAKLYFLRDRIGKARKLREKRVTHLRTRSKKTAKSDDESTGEKPRELAGVQG